MDEVALAKEVAEYKLRTEDEKKLGDDGYWKVNGVRKPMMFMFLQMVMATTVTEASVERSFALQCRTYSPLRSRLSIEMVNHIMFIKANVCKPLAEPKKEKEKKITYTITQDDWEKLALNLSEPLIQPTHLTRMATRKEQALNIPRYATVKVKWNVENGGEWCEGVVTEVPGNGVSL